MLPTRDPNIRVYPDKIITCIRRNQGYGYEQCQFIGAANRPTASGGSLARPGISVTTRQSDAGLVADCHGLGVCRLGFASCERTGATDVAGRTRHDIVTASTAQALAERVRQRDGYADSARQ